MKKKLTIGIVGAGYVGYSLALLYAEKNKVILNEIDSKKLEKLKKNIPLIESSEIKKYLTRGGKNLSFSSDLMKTAIKSDIIFIALPTNFNNKVRSFDTSIIESVINKLLEVKHNLTVVIKSTVPIGFTEKLISKHKNKNIMFSPEFLREGKSIRDNLFPDRLIIGSLANKDKRKSISKVMESIVLKKNIQCIEMLPSDAEAVKLFSNSYLAMRVSFFNELDSLCLKNNLDSKSIIHGVSLDKRIGNFYNNPSFGFGGYCLPKDLQQMESHFKNIPNNILIESINSSNKQRIQHIVDSVLKYKPKIVGICGVQMKAGSDNYRESPSLKVAHALKKQLIKVIIYEDKIPFNDDNFESTDDLDYFDKTCDIILHNRTNEISKKLKTRTFTRDIFNRD